MLTHTHTHTQTGTHTHTLTHTHTHIQTHRHTDKVFSVVVSLDVLCKSIAFLLVLLECRSDRSQLRNTGQTVQTGL